MKVVFDTNVLLSATIWHSSVASKLLRQLIASDVIIACSSDILKEYVAVLKRDFSYDGAEVEDMVQAVMAFVKTVQILERVDFIKDDPTDNRILECALAAGASYILSYDKHLLKIEEYRGIRIIRPDEARTIF